MLLRPMFSRFFLAAAISVLSACAMNSNTSSSSSETSAAGTSTPSTLSAYHWDLSDVRNASGAVQKEWLPPNTSVRLSFDDQRVAISGLCNLMGAGYRLDAGAIEISPVVGTMMACPDAGLMQYEQAIAKRLPQAATWSITQHPEAPLLTLGFDDGAQWTLTGTPTDETRFGGPGQTIFLEVASQRVACSHPLIPNMQCLKVRDIQYDANGIKTGHGEWQTFYSEIEGYTHQPGVRNVLRIKRYERPQTPADASRYAYVLDMVVESAQE